MGDVVDLAEWDKRIRKSRKLAIPMVGIRPDDLATLVACARALIQAQWEVGAGEPHTDAAQVEQDRVVALVEAALANVTDTATREDG